jgi:hypothetical protein
MVADSSESKPSRNKWALSVANTFLAELPLLAIVIGYLLGQRWLFWAGLIGIGLYLAAGAIYGLAMGVYLPVYTLRKWQGLPLFGKVVLTVSSLFVLLCLGGILITWARTRP